MRPWLHAYVETEPDTIVERRDTNSVEELTENKLDWLIWDSQRTWHQGAGQLRFDASTSLPGAFQSSVGVDCSTPGQATLMTDITTQAGFAGNVDSRKMIVSGGQVFAEDISGGTYRLAKFTPGSAVTAWTLSTGGTRPYGMASDGKNVYVALGASGVDKGAASGTSSANYSSADIRAIHWAKQQLVGAGLKTGTQWRLVAIGSGAGSTELLVMPDGFTVAQNAIDETGGFVYFGAMSDHVSVIYAWDGTNPPYVAVQLPDGDQVTSILGFQGEKVMVGVRRLVQGGTGKGVLYEATPDSNGYLTLVEIAEFGAADANDYALTAMGVHGKHVHFTWVPYGLGVFLPEFTSYFRGHGNLSTETRGGDIVVWKDTHLFSYGNDVYYELMNQYVSSGQIVGSLMDWNIDANKIVLRGEAGFKTLPAGTRVAFEYSTDEGVTFNAVATASTGSNAADKIGVVAKSVVYRVTLYSNTGSNTLTPTLKKAGIGSWYGEKSRSQHVLAVKAYDRMKLRNDTDYPGTGPGLAESIFSTLRDLRTTQAVVTFQPPGYGDTNTRTLNVNVRSLEARTGWNSGSGYGKVILVTLVEVGGRTGTTWAELLPRTWASLSAIEWGDV